ncbi:MAG: hypothetical protein H0V88_13210 [Pyrinomonadaceae bacterium]|nr:hypothetical protein [Pyrinomonadaceae bacterium]
MSQQTEDKAQLSDFSRHALPIRREEAGTLDEVVEIVRNIMRADTTSMARRPRVDKHSLDFYRHVESNAAEQHGQREFHRPHTLKMKNAP